MFTQPSQETRYLAGLDVHLKYVSVAVVARDGQVQLEQSVSTRDPDALAAVLAPYHSAEAPLAAVVETCPFWAWVYDQLTAVGIRVVVAHARELRAIATSHRKTDERDALLLARMLGAGLIPVAVAHPRAARDVLVLLRHRAALVKQRTQCANRIHGQLHQQRLALPRERLLRRATRLWLKETARPRLLPAQWQLVRTHLGLIRGLTRLIRVLDREIKTRAAASPTAGLLQTIPGIGPYRGLLLATTLAPITRFASPARLVGYAGLAPRSRSTGGHTRHGPIPRAANHAVRGALVSAIPTHVRFRPTSELSQAYERLKARVGWRVARVAAARRLARQVYAMLRTGECWRDGQAPGVVANREGELRSATVVSTTQTDA